MASPRPDPIGLPIVGYGHLCRSRGCSEVPFKFPLTQVQATTLVKSDLKTPENCIKDYTSHAVRLNDDQHGALVDGAFNVGCGNVRTSGLVHRLNAGQNPNTVAAQELPEWKKGGGKMLPSLVRRIVAEAKLFQTTSSVPALPACRAHAKVDQLQNLISVSNSSFTIGYRVLLYLSCRVVQA